MALTYGKNSWGPNSGLRHGVFCTLVSGVDNYLFISVQLGKQGTLLSLQAGLIGPEAAYFIL